MDAGLDLQVPRARHLAFSHAPDVSHGVLNRMQKLPAGLTPRRLAFALGDPQRGRLDRKSTRLNSSHLVISYAVFCLKKKKKESLQTTTHTTLHKRRALRPLHTR